MRALTARTREHRRMWDGTVAAPRDVAAAVVVRLRGGDPEVPPGPSLASPTTRNGRVRASAALHVCGAYGLNHEMANERHYRQANFYEVAPGSLELQRVIVGKVALTGLAKDRFERGKDS